MWYIKLHVKEVISSMLAKPADMLQLEFGYIKRKIPISENTLLNGVVHRIILNGTFSSNVKGLKN